MEEDIKILKEMITWDSLLPNKRQTEAMENLIKGYRELEQCLEVTSKSLNNVAYDQIPLAIQDLIVSSIPKSKIKDKIEELEHEKFKRTYLGFFPKYNCENRILLAKIQVLQELMEDK